jgi:hypothetical protein
VERTAPSSETAALWRIKDERSSTQKCLQICAQFSKLINQIQPSWTENLAQGSDNILEKITSEGIWECRASIEQTAARLERHVQDILDQMMSNPSATMTQEDKGYLARLREEWTTARKCRAICFQADQRLMENIIAIINHARATKPCNFLCRMVKKQFMARTGDIETRSNNSVVISVISQSKRYLATFCR